MRRLQVVVSGRVQGVSYRAFVVREAKALGLTGQVCNAPDGSVEVIAEGNAYALETFLVHLQEKHTLADVERITECWSSATGAFTDFHMM